MALALLSAACDERSEPGDEASTDDGSQASSGEDAPAPEPTEDDGAPGGSESDGDATTEPPPEPVPGFAEDVLPIVQQSCNCHGAGAEAGVDLSDEAAYDTLVFGESSIGVPFVVPGDPDDSYVVLKLRGEQASVGGSGSRMPLGTPLPDEQIAIIEAWVAGGAPE